MRFAAAVAALLLSGSAFAATNVQGNILSNTTWNLAGSPYNLVGDVTVVSGATLTIDPGVVVTAPGGDTLASGSNTSKAELIVNGALSATGTSTQKITFTSSAGNGGWYGIRALSGSTVTVGFAAIDKAIHGLSLAADANVSNTSISSSINSNVYVSAGAATLTGLDLAGSGNGVEINGGTPSISRTVIHGAGYGVYLSSSSASVTLDRVTVADNSSYGIYAYSGSVTVTNSILARNGSYNAYRYNGAISVSNTDWWMPSGSSGNSGATSGSGNLSANPLFVSSTDYHLTSNSPARKAGNPAGSDIGAFDYVAGTNTASLQGTLFTDTTLTGANSIIGDLTVPAGVKLTLAAGATLTFATTDGMASGTDTSHIELIVNGTLDVQGTSSSPVTFTSTGGNGSWYGIRVVSGTTTNIANANISRAINGLSFATAATVSNVNVTGSTNSNVYVASGAPTLTGLVLSGGGNGIELSGGSPTVSRTLIYGASYGVYLSSSSASVALDHLTVADNSSYGIYAYNGSVTVTNSILARNGSYNAYRYNGSISVSNTDWWMASGSSGNSGAYSGTGNFSSNPLFVSGTDYHLTSNSPARNGASDSSDLGAFAYVAGTLTPALQGSLWTDTTLSGAQTVVGDLVVPTGRTLTLAAGATLSFATSDGMASGIDTSHIEVIVQGTLVVQGSSGSPVTFTSTGGNGSWYGLRIIGGGGTVVDNAVISKAINGVSASVAATVSNTTINGATNSNVYVTAGSPTFSGLILSGGGNGVEVAGGSPTFSRTVISGASYGVYLSAPASNATLDHVTVADNSSYGLYVYNGSATVTNSILARNGSYNAYRYNGYLTVSNTDWWMTSGSSGNSGGTSGAGNFSSNPLFVSGTDYHLTSNSPARNSASDGSDLGAFAFVPGTLTSSLQGTLWVDTVISGGANVVGDLVVPAGRTLTLSPGATLTFAASDGMASGIDTSHIELIVYGTLVVQGSSTSKVVFTDSSTSNGSWYGIRLLSGTSSVNYASIDKAVNGISMSAASSVTNTFISGSTSAGIYVTAGAPTIAYVEISGGSNGIEVAGGTPDVSWTLIRGASYGVYTSYTSTTTKLDHVTIADNSSYGIYAYAGTVNVTSSIVVRNGTYNGYKYNGTINETYTDSWMTSGAAGNSGVSGTTGNITANPLFVSATDYHLTSSSPARTFGAGGSDMGAFPFTVGAVATITVSPTNPNITVGSTSGFTAQAFDSSGNPIPGVAFTWTAVPSVGTINGSGQLTASCTPTTGVVSNAVTASASGKSGSTAVTLVAGPINSVTVSPKTVSVPGGGTQQFTAVAKDSCQNVVPATFTWTAGSNSGTVSSSGLYTAPCTLGNYVGAVQVSTGAISDSATVNVTSGALAQLNISPLNPSLPAGGTQQFSASGTDTCGNNVTSPTVTWSANGTAGSITTAGLFTAGSTAGTYNNAVTATSGSKTASTNVTVTGGTVATVVVTPNTVTLDRGQVQTFTAQARDSFGNVVAGNPSWTVTDTNAGSIDPGLGTFTAGTKAGTFTQVVVATIAGVQGKATVAVRPGPASNVVVVPSSITIAPSGQSTFSAQVFDSSGNARSGDTITWAVTNSAAGSITQGGVFTAGSAQGSYNGVVTATVGSATGSASVTITAGALSQLIVQPGSATVRANNTVQFQAQGKDSSGNTVATTVTWTVLQGGGTISSTGLFTAGTVPGTYVDTVQATAPGGLSATATVIVQPGPVVTVEVAPAYPELPPGTTQQFTATAKDAFGNTIQGASVTWSATAAAGTINAAGLFTAGSTPGDYPSAVTASETGGVQGTASVRVLRVITDGGTGGGAGGGSGGGAGGGEGGGAGGGDGTGGVGAQGGCGCNGVAGLFPGALLLMLAAGLRRRR